MPEALTKLVTRSGISSTLKSITLGLDDALEYYLDTLGDLFLEVPALETLKLLGEGIDTGLMAMVPASLKELTLELTSGDARAAFREYSNEHPTSVRVSIVEEDRVATFK